MAAHHDPHIHGHLISAAPNGFCGETFPNAERDPLWACLYTHRAKQVAGTIHVHPNGRVVYIANRSDYTVDYQGRKVFGGGEDTLASFSLDAATGEPTLLQHADSHCCHHVRTFAFDPGGTMMVAASIKSMAVRDGDKVTTVPAALSVFRVGADGRFDCVRKYHVDTAPARTSSGWG